MNTLTRAAVLCFVLLGHCGTAICSAQEAIPAPEKKESPCGETQPDPKKKSDPCESIGTSTAARLAEQLGDDNRYVAEEAANALEAMGTEAACVLGPMIKNCVKNLGNPKTELRIQRAALVLGRMGNRVALEGSVPDGLLALANEKGASLDVRITAIDAIGRIKAHRKAVVKKIEESKIAQCTKINENAKKAEENLTKAETAADAANKKRLALDALQLAKSAGQSVKSFQADIIQLSKTTPTRGCVVGPEHSDRIDVESLLERIDTSINAVKSNEKAVDVAALKEMLAEWKTLKKECDDLEKDLEKETANIDDLLGKLGDLIKDKDNHPAIKAVAAVAVKRIYAPAP
jgi:hypothetical protein